MFKELFDSLTRANVLPYEQACLVGWRASLSEETKEVLDKQLAAAWLVQRQAGGAKVCFYYREDASLPLLYPDGPDLHAATVILGEPAESTARSMRVKVYVHRGRFFSLEFPKRPERFASQHRMDLRQLIVGRVKTHHVLTPGE